MTSHCLLAVQQNAWIGLHSLANHMFFEWTNYDPVEYTNWARREPNNMGDGEDCVNIYYYVRTDVIKYVRRHNSDIARQVSVL